MRVLAGGFKEMLHKVKVSESNPPLYYLLAWPGPARGRGRGRPALAVGTVRRAGDSRRLPCARELAGRRAGLIRRPRRAQPDLIWYSQEARSYALLVCLSAWGSSRSCARWEPSRRTLALWALASALALASTTSPRSWSLEALLLVALARALAGGVAGPRRGRRHRPRPVAARPTTQTNPTHIGWIENSPLPERLWETGVSFLVGETGHVIAEAPRERYALVPIDPRRRSPWPLVAARGGRRERRGAVLGLTLGLGVVALTAIAALGRQGLRGRAQPAAGAGAATGGGRARLRGERRPPSSASSSRSPSAPTGSPSTSTSPRRPTCSAPTPAPSPTRSGRRAAAGRSSPGSWPPIRSATTSTTGRSACTVERNESAKSPFSASPW